MELTFRPNLASLSLTGMPFSGASGLVAPMIQDGLHHRL